MAQNILLGTDSWARFPVREYVDVGENETIFTLRTTQHENRCADTVSSAAHRMTTYTECVFQTGQEHRLVFGHDTPVSYSRDHRYWITVNIVTPTRGCKVSTGLYYARLRDEWSPSGIVVDASGCQLPLTPLVDSSLKPGDTLSTSVVSLAKINWDNVSVKPEPQPNTTDLSSPAPRNISCVQSQEKDTPSQKSPPPSMTVNMSEDQQSPFLKLWDKIPPHLHDINFGINHAEWGTVEIAQLADVLLHYEYRFSRDKTDVGHCTALPFRIELNPGTCLIKQRPYRRNPAINAKVQIEIDKLLAAGVRRKSNFHWASPLVVVMKKDGNIRLTCNYQRLNDATIIPVLPLPSIDELLDSLGGSTVFSVLDLASGFFQAAIEPDSIPLTAVCTKTGLYEWLRMPMGTSGSPGSFQRLMTQVCEGLQRVQLYLDDIVVHSKSGSHHVTNLRGFLARQYNLKLAPKKAHIGAPEVQFLGHSVSPFGVSPDPKKIDAMLKMTMPSTERELRSLLGSVSYLRKF